MDINKIFDKKNYYDAVRSKLDCSINYSYLTVLPIELYNLLIDYISGDVKIFTRNKYFYLIYKDMYEHIPAKFLQVNISAQALHMYCVCGKGYTLSDLYNNKISFTTGPVGLNITVNENFMSFVRSGQPVQTIRLEYLDAIIFREKLKLAMECSEIIKKFEKESEFI